MCDEGCLLKLMLSLIFGTVPMLKHHSSETHSAVDVQIREFVNSALAGGKQPCSDTS